MTEGVPSPGLLFEEGRNRRIDRFHGDQLPISVVLGGIQRRHIHPWNLSQVSEPFRPRCLPAALQSIDEGGQQKFAVPQQHGIKEWCEWFGVGREHWTAAENDRILISPLQGPDRNPLVLQQLRQHRAVELPAQGQPEQIATPGQGIVLVREQSPNVDIAALRQGGPDDLITQAGDPHGIGAGEGQHGLQGTGLR